MSEPTFEEMQAELATNRAAAMRLRVPEPEKLPKPKPGELHAVIFAQEVTLNGRRYQVELLLNATGGAQRAWQQVVATAIRGKGRKSTWGGLITLKASPITLK